SGAAAGIPGSDRARTLPGDSMSTYLYAIGAFCFRRRWLVLGVWLAVLVGAASAAVGLRGQPSDDFSIPGTESQRAIEILEERMPAFSGAQTQITFATPGDARLTDPVVIGAIDNALQSVRTIPDVAVA